MTSCLQYTKDLKDQIYRLHFTAYNLLLYEKSSTTALHSSSVQKSSLCKKHPCKASNFGG